MSFQTGVDTIYNSCIAYGSTPIDKTSASIVNAIKEIYTNGYNAGKAAAGGDVKHNCYVSLVVNAKAHGQNIFYAYLYKDGSVVASTQQTYGDIQPANFGTTTKSSTVSI